MRRLVSHGANPFLGEAGSRGGRIRPVGWTAIR